jgi:hypothetical protein
MSHDGKHGRRQRRNRRAALQYVLRRLARRLGLDGHDLALYAEAAFGRPWRRLAQPHLLLVLESLGELAACRAELRRRGCARREGRRA